RADQIALRRERLVARGLRLTGDEAQADAKHQEFFTGFVHDTASHALLLGATQQRTHGNEGHTGMTGGPRVMLDQRKRTGRRAIRPLALAASLMLGAMAAQPAVAQFSDSYRFLEAVRKSDNAKIVEVLETPGVTPINTRDR